MSSIPPWSPAGRARSLGIAMVITLLLSSGMVGAASAGAQTLTAEPEPIAPSSVVGLGDSITRGFNACGFYVECTSRSWAVGDNRSTRSVVSRFRAASATPITASNVAQSGAVAADLEAQAVAAVEVGGDLVTVQIGGNDACTETVSDMTSVEDFEQSVSSAFLVLDDGLPQASVLVMSIPDPVRLWEAGRGSWWTRTIWNVLDVCQSVLASPLDRSTSATARREYVRQRVEAYNAVLAELCDARERCSHDDGASFSYPFTLREVSSWDYFHPNARGQAALAQIGWQALQQ